MTRAEKKKLTTARRDAQEQQRRQNLARSSLSASTRKTPQYKPNPDAHREQGNGANAAKASRENAALGLAVISLAVSLLQSVSGNSRSVWTKVGFLLFVAFGCWWVAEHLRRGGKTVIASILIPSPVGVLICGVLAAWAYSDWYADTLLPASRQTSNKAVLFMGGDAYEFEGTNRTTILSIGGRDLIDMEFRQGEAYLHGQFFGRNGDILAVLKDNRLITNAENTFRTEHPDKSTFNIWNKQNKVLSVQRTTKTSFVLSGTLWSADGREIVISKDNVTIGRLSISGMHGPHWGHRPGDRIFVIE